MAVASVEASMLTAATIAIRTITRTAVTATKANFYSIDFDLD
jgi:hypothetical protein